MICVNKSSDDYRSNKSSMIDKMVEKELLKSKNTKYSQVISKKDDTIDSHSNINHTSNGDVQIDDINQTSTFNAKSMQMSPLRNRISSGKKQMKERKVNLLTLHRCDVTNQLISRVTEELTDGHIEKFHKTLDLGESRFIEKFLELETSI